MDKEKNPKCFLETFTVGETDDKKVIKVGITLDFKILKDIKASKKKKKRHKGLFIFTLVHLFSGSYYRICSTQMR